MKKNSLLEILTFEVFVTIFKYIQNFTSGNTDNTDVNYYFGTEDGGSPHNIPYGNFRMKAYPEQIEYLGKEILILEPFGQATKPDEQTEYYIMVVNAHDMFGGNYTLWLQKMGHMGRAVAGERTEIKLDINQMTNIIIVCPMNVSEKNDIYYQTHYHFENLVYAQNGELYIPYYQYERKIHDNRD